VGDTVNLTWAAEQTRCFAAPEKQGTAA